jgi:hypothetical protein
MKYFLIMAMFFALSTSVLAEGGARVFEFTYSHRVKFVDPSNNPSDALGISSPVVGGNIIGGADCIPGIANCVGGSNTYGPTWRVFYGPSGLDSIQDGPVARRVVPGKYYNPNVLSKTDKTFSGLTDLTFTLTKNNNTVWTTTISFSSISSDPDNPTTFNQTDVLTGVWLGQGSIFKDNDGAIHFTSAPLISSTLDENSDFLLTVTPIATSSVITTPLTRIYLGETLVSQAPKTGETKYSSNSANHEGWYLMNGISNASITNVNARAAAEMMFGGAGGNIPNMDGLYTVAETTSGQAYNAAGVVNNEITVANSNIHQVTFNTTTDGNHYHSGSVFANLGYAEGGGGGVPINGSESNQWIGFNTDYAGSHNHQVTIGQASPTPISIQPRSAKLYQFVYLGQ